MSAIKRIAQDLKELEREPVHGISLSMPSDNDPFTLHANILVSDGPYTGLLIHTIIHLPKEYPMVGPAMNIAPNLGFDHRFHEHVLGSSICNDMLTNFEYFFKYADGEKKPVATGWTSGCTLKTLLLQMTVFFSDHDLPSRSAPTKAMIDELRVQISGYKCDICGHTTKKPYPEPANVSDSSVKVISALLVGAGGVVVFS